MNNDQKNQKPKKHCVVNMYNMLFSQQILKILKIESSITTTITPKYKQRRDVRETDCHYGGYSTHLLDTI